MTTRGCVSPRSMQIEPWTPRHRLAVIFSTCSNAPHDDVAVTMALGWLQPSFIESSVENLDGHRWGTCGFSTRNEVPLMRKHVS